VFARHCLTLIQKIQSVYSILHSHFKAALWL
jgi:hypothetical protein